MVGNAEQEPKDQESFCHSVYTDQTLEEIAMGFDPSLNWGPYTAGDTGWYPTDVNLNTILNRPRNTSSGYDITMATTDTAMTDSRFPPSDADAGNLPVMKQEPSDFSGLVLPTAYSNMTGNASELAPLIQEVRDLLAGLQQKLVKPLESVQRSNAMFDHGYLSTLRDLSNQSLASLSLIEIRDKLREVDGTDDQVKLIFGKKTQALKNHVEGELQRVFGLQISKADYTADECMTYGVPAR